MKIKLKVKGREFDEDTMESIGCFLIMLLTCVMVYFIKKDNYERGFNRGVERTIEEVNKIIDKQKEENKDKTIHYKEQSI